ncbi:hypothetical protein NC653_035533 [Populus alba x Populus x berolinensis]|uniref:Uncharacterized protein n=1 Tax=Populus alba x Populus x berolinensis TaxID=444605 RepID=A0AAD6LQ63_9ROSI|nr:hypothetical protein NC653_035533 [Populus alba x Populus x berolinensis]
MKWESAATILFPYFHKSCISCCGWSENRISCCSVFVKWKRKS